MNALIKVSLSLNSLCRCFLMVGSLVLCSPSIRTSAAGFPGIHGNKTLVSWVSLSNLDQRGGSVLTLDDNQAHFDGIVFGEIAPSRWMAGSDFYNRSLRNQNSLAKESSTGSALVQIAIVYEGPQVTLYRNGQEYSKYSAGAPLEFGKDSAVIFGLRHLDAQDGACFAGSIEDARIYDIALTAAQIRKLSPNKESTPKPIAWWNFESGKPVDVMGSFPDGKLVGKARVESGKLILDGNGSFMATPASAASKASGGAGPDVSPEWVLNYHLMHPGASSLPGDPNPAFYLDGVYHLHYILGHRWRGRGSFSFIHVTSPDMLHWTWQPTKLQPSFTGHGMFSGTGFETLDGRPAAIYHGEGSGKNQIAIAKDRKLSAWEKPYPVDVRNAGGSPAKINHWDPDCFIIGDTYYAISGGVNPPLFKSKDLKTWTLVGDFVRSHPSDVTIGEDISCPNFFRIGNKWMLLCISHPLGCRYYIGDWDAKAEQFVPERHGRMNWGRSDQPIWGVLSRSDFFAPESVLTPDGRRVMWAWIVSAGPESKLVNKTIQSLPRELSLAPDGSLRIQPLRELEKQRADHKSLDAVTISHALTGHGDPIPPRSAPALQRITELPGESSEIHITISQKEAARKLFGVVLFSNGKGGGLPVLFRPETGRIRVGSNEAPFQLSDLKSDEDVDLRIYVDRYFVEVFVNGVQALVAAYPDHQGKLGVDGFTVGAPTTLKHFETWKIEPTNQGFFEAQKNRVWEPDRN